MKQYAKFKIELNDKKNDKYLGYIQTNNELNLLYDDLTDKNGDEADTIKKQINMNKEEWEKYNKNENEEDIAKENIIKNKINEKDISNLNSTLNNSIQKMKELIKGN